MSYSRRSRYSCSPSPSERGGRSSSRSRSMSHESSDAENPGNNLYVTGLSPRITKRDLEKHFSTEGKVVEVHLVVDPWTRETRGFGFVTMSTLEEAGRCIKHLDRSVLEGRVITVEKARRRRGRTPTPGKYLGLRIIRGGRRSPSYSSYRRSRSRSYSSDDRSRRRSPYYRRRGSPSPYGRPYSPYHPPYYRRRGSPSPYGRTPYGLDDYHYGRRWSSRSRHRGRSYSYSASSRSPSYSRSVSPEPRRVAYRSWRGYSPSISPRPRSYRRSYSRSVSPQGRSHRRSGYVARWHGPYSRGSPSMSSASVSSSYRSVSRSVSPSY